LLREPWDTSWDLSPAICSPKAGATRQEADNGLKSHTRQIIITQDQHGTNSHGVPGAFDFTHLWDRQLCRSQMVSETHPCVSHELSQRSTMWLCWYRHTCLGTQLGQLIKAEIQERIEYHILTFQHSDSRHRGINSQSSVIPPLRENVSLLKESWGLSLTMW
jgi:hypothetical protein